MPDDDRFRDFQSVHQRNHITHGVDNGIVLHQFGRIGLPMASHVECDRTIARQRAGFQLMAP